MKYNLVLDIDYNVFATEAYQNSQGVKLEFPNECICEFIDRPGETVFRYVAYLYPRELSKTEGFAVFVYDNDIYRFIDSCYKSKASGFIYSDSKIVWCS